MGLTTVITGSASGIGAATRKRLEDEGHGVIGIDIRNAEVIADLSTQEGRQTAVSAVLEKCEGHLDRLVVSAGLGAHTRPPSLIASVNYFGAVEVVDGLLSGPAERHRPCRCCRLFELRPNDAHGRSALRPRAPGAQREGGLPHHRRGGRPSLGIPGLEERPRQGGAPEVCPVGRGGRPHQRSGSRARNDSPAARRHGRSSHRGGGSRS